jgi:hypothetical protein
MTEGNIAAFLQDVSRAPASKRQDKIVVGVDECLNCKEINGLARTLVGRELVAYAAPLWIQTRERDGVIIGTFSGGVDRDSILRQSNPLIPDIGVPVAHRSWSDFRVIQMLVAKFTTYEKVVLLSANTRFDEGGLRKLLNEVIAPELQNHAVNLSLTALFKKGKTPIEKYCRDVLFYFETKHFHRGYFEQLL